MKYDKKFLIIGNQNAITYKEVFQLHQGRQDVAGLWLSGNCAHFVQSEPC